MKVLISKDIFDETKSDQEELELNFLIHLVMLKDSCDLLIDDNEILNSNYVGKMNDNEKRVFQEAFNNCISSSAEHDCEVNPIGEYEIEQKVFSRSEAIRYLLQPLSLLVENSLNDAYFLRALFNAFDKEGALLIAYNNNWLQFDNAGGCTNVENYINAQVAHFQGKTKFLRYWVMLDGDKRYSTQVVSKYNKLVKQLEDWNIEYHILDKRCMENYMPTKAIELLKNKVNEDWINAYLSLSENQKDYLNIGGGFIKDLSTEDQKKAKEKEAKLSSKDKKRKKQSYVRNLLDPLQKKEYDNVTPAHFKALEGGLKLKDKFKDTFPKSFEDPAVNERTLKERVQHQSNPNELQEIVNSIKKLL